MRRLTRKDYVYVTLSGLFIVNALLGELLGGKLIEVFGYTMSVGVVPWPVVFLTTDLINEYFGKAGVRRITFATAALILYAFVVIYAAMLAPAARSSPVSDQVFNTVFGQSLWLIIASMIAF